MSAKTKEEIENVVKQCYSYADVCRMLGWKPIGGNYRIVHKYIEKYGIDTSHFDQTKSSKRKNIYEITEKPCSYYFENNIAINGSILLKKLIKEGFKENKCECCGNTEWLNEPIPLELHHIDGNHANNKLENIKLLCPNCHTKTENFRGKKNKVEHYCKICGRQITKWSKKILCQECAHNEQKRNKWNKEQLIEDIKNLHTNTAIAKKYNVSDNTIAKWRRIFEI